MRALLLLATVLTAAAAPADDLAAFPTRTLAAGRLVLTVALPDAERGFYRGTRYDWSGMILQAELNGHGFLARYRTPQDPTDPSHGAGTAEEFGQESPPGYEEAAVGGIFFKPGVGLLRRASAGPYRFGQRFEQVEGGSWQVEEIPGGLHFVHRLESATGWGYVYEKKLTLRADGTGFAIGRRLQNTGNRRIDTSHYSHHFLRFEKRRIDEHYELTLPAALTPSEPRPVTIAGLALRPAGAAVEKPFLVRFTHPAVPADRAVALRHRETEAELSFQVDVPLSDFRVYLAPELFCPEPFVPIVLAPGAACEWTTTYKLQAPR